MLEKIKSRIEREIPYFFDDLNEEYSLKDTSAALFKSITDFVSRTGKRIRPCLFVIGYLGYGKKEPSGLYRCAISLELLHDFLLVHDDIIDKSATRRGKPSMHEIFNKQLSSRKNIKFNGQDLAIVAGDVISSMGIRAFLAIKEDPLRKEKALIKFNEAAMYTCFGEAIELLYGLKGIDKITKNDIYKIYDLKTAYYTFSAPLVMGAILGGANTAEQNALLEYGKYLGRAFQIKDDIIGLFCEQKETGKSNLTDLQEDKKTLLIWQAYNNSTRKNKLAIRRILSKNTINKQDLLKMRKLVADCGSLDCAKKEVSCFSKKASELINSSAMNKKYKKLLESYSQEILKL